MMDALGCECQPSERTLTAGEIPYESRVNRMAELRWRFERSFFTGKIFRKWT